jgi:hypothetical protein
MVQQREFISKVGNTITFLCITVEPESDDPRQVQPPILERQDATLSEWRQAQTDKAIVSLLLSAEQCQTPTPIPPRSEKTQQILDQMFDHKNSQE